MSDTVITLETRDNKTFVVPKSVAIMLVTVANLVAVDDSDDNVASSEVIKLENVDSDIFKKVLEYCTFHQEKKDSSREEKEAFDKKFVDVSDDVLFSLILAANYLDCKSLLDLTCKTVAEIIKTEREPDKIKHRFGVNRPFTPEDEEQLCMSFVLAEAIERIHNRKNIETIKPEENSVISYEKYERKIQQTGTPSTKGQCFNMASENGAASPIAIEYIAL